MAWLLKKIDRNSGSQPYLPAQSDPNKKRCFLKRAGVLPTKPKARAAQLVGERDPIKVHRGTLTHCLTYSQTSVHVCVCPRVCSQPQKVSRSIQDLRRQGCIPDGLLGEIKGYNVVRPSRLVRKWSCKQAEKIFLPQHTHTRSLIQLMYFVQSRMIPLPSGMIPNKAPADLIQQLLGSYPLARQNERDFPPPTPLFVVHT